MIFIWWPFFKCNCDDDDWDDLSWLDADWLFYGVIIFFLSLIVGVFAWGQGWWNPIELIDKIMKCFT